MNPLVMESEIMGKKLFFSILLVCMAICTTAFAGESGLIGLLTSQLGVTNNQAEAGAGAIFQSAKSGLNESDFGTIAKAVPEVYSLMNAAPKKEETISKSIGGLTSALGTSTDKLEGAAGLLSSFNKLDMGDDMVGKFTTVILDYVKQKGGEHAMNLLKGALS